MPFKMFGVTWCAWQYSPGCVLTHVASQAAEVLQYSHVHVVAPVLQHRGGTAGTGSAACAESAALCMLPYSVARLLCIKGLV
jgi:hypothetical protein